MNRKNYYIAIICVLLIFLILYFFFNWYYIYADASRIENKIRAVDPTVDDITRVLCDPISRGNTALFGNSAAAKKYCASLV